ncbi:MAG: cation-transporting P-type ATPase [Xanthomonadales bacterium]|nr:cation-transporting P-type ATPase [Xanthomonadales bacterium]
MTARSIPEAVLVGLAGETGLGSADAESRLRRHGANDIVADVPHRTWQALRDAARDPMPWFLLVTSGLFWIIGDRLEAAILLLAIVPLLGMDAWLHRRTLASTQGLASRLAAHATVLRDGRWQQLPARALVPGDLVELTDGAWCPADGLVMSGADLQVDESSLTGESLPVRKRPLPLPAGDRAATEHWLLAGTRLLSGTARMRVACTGTATRYGEIVELARTGPKSRTPLQRSVTRLVAMMVLAATVLCLALAAVRLAQGHGPVDALLSALTLAIAALPEEFPVVLSVFLGVGVFRLARRQALVRRAVAVEAIGRVDVLCSDKTGTLTEGQLRLVGSHPADGADPAGLLALVAASIRADSIDALDRAVLAATAGRAGERLGGVPFTEARRREFALLRLPDGGLAGVLKGAPEQVFAHCTLDPATQARWLARVADLASQGQKVIACAQRPLPPGSEPTEEPTHGFLPAGLLAFADPLRADARDAVQACQTQGIRVVMVTGDHPDTARAIALALGLGGGDPAIRVPGDGAGAADDLAAVDVVARATPRDKLDLVRALQARGHTVAVTGDGVNDVPALEAADIGIAMGERGTRPAREVAAIVLLDDALATLAGAVAEGRQLFRNLQLAFVYLLLVHMPFVASAALLPLLGQPLLFLPIHVVWLELVIHPTALLAFQQAADLRHRAPPRGRHALFPTGTVPRLLLAGTVATAAVAVAYQAGLAAGAEVPAARSLALAVLLLMMAGYLTALTRLRTRVARGLALATLASIVLLQVPAASAVLMTRPLSPGQWLLILPLAGVGLLAALPLLHGLAVARRLAPTPRTARPGYGREDAC